MEKVSSGAALWQPRFARLVRFFGHEHVCMRRTLLNLRQAGSLAFSVCGDTLGIIPAMVWLCSSTS